VLCIVVVIWLLSGCGFPVLCVGCTLRWLCFALVVICVVCGVRCASCFVVYVGCALCFALLCLFVGCDLVVLCALLVRWWFVLYVDRGLVVIWLRFGCAVR
jgi:hypothetical protein